MPNDQNSSQGRRQHYHRGRRGGDRRGSERRTPPAAQDAGQRGDHFDVEQIMRDIRSRIAKRHGIDLSSQQIHELAARRLEAILEPRHVKPALMEQMRRAAGEPIEVPAPPQTPQTGFQETELYESHRGIIRLLRKWLNPILKLFFNPTPIARALDAQMQRNNEAAAREAELYARQAEWNALHYELLQRLVIEVSRNSLEVQNLTMRVESLATRVEFSERRVRSFESPGQPPPRPSRAVEAPASGEPRPHAAAAPDTPTATLGSGDVPAAAPAEGSRRRRRRRRGRRSGAGAAGDAAANTADGGSPAGLESDADLEGDAEGDEAETSNGADAATVTPEPSASLEPAHTFSLLQPVERQPSVESPVLERPRPQAEPFDTAAQHTTPLETAPAQSEMPVEAATPERPSGSHQRDSSSHWAAPTSAPGDDIPLERSHTVVEQGQHGSLAVDPSLTPHQTTPDTPPVADVIDGPSPTSDERNATGSHER